MFVDIQKNLISVIILIILFVSLIRQLNWKNHINKVFFYLIGLNTTLLILDSIIILINGRDSLGATIALHASVGVYYSIVPVFALLWLYYVNMNIFQDKNRLYKISIYPCLIVIINFILVLLSYRYNILFNISSENLFVRGDYHFIIVLLTLSIVLITNYHILKYKTHIRKKEFTPLIFFSVPPLISTIVLLLFKDINLIWNSVIVSQLLIYIYIQSKITSTDFLTGLYNRREYEFVVKDLSTSRSKHKIISGVMVDINDFKNINDQFGHRVGDEILIATSRILKSAIRKQDYVFRVGGDEFLIVIVSDDKYTVNHVINRIEEILKNYNEKSLYDFTLSLSIGKGIYDEKTYVDIPSFFEHLDLMMYDDKKYFKNIQGS